MNYIEQIVSFYRWKEVNPLPASAIALWHEIMAVCNKAGWPQEFTIPNAVLQSNAGLSRKEFEKARQILITEGRIVYKKSHRVNQAGKYAIIPFSIVQKGHQEGKQEEQQQGKREGHGRGTLNNKLKPNEKVLYINAPARENFLPLINSLSIDCRGVYELELLDSYQGMMDSELIKAALKRSENKSIPYAIKILENWKKNGHTKLEDILPTKGGVMREKRKESHTVPYDEFDDLSL